MAWKKLNLKQQEHTFTNQKKCTTTQKIHKKIKPNRLIRHPASKRSGFILKGKVREKISKEKVKKKRISGEVYDINKQTIYTALTLKQESRAHYALQPAQGYYLQGK